MELIIASVVMVVVVVGLHRIQNNIQFFATEILAAMEIHMATVREYYEAVKTHQGRQDTAIAGIADDIEEVKRRLEEIQDNPGPISDEDQRLLDEALNLVSGTTDKLEALDQLTPPVAPNPEPTPTDSTGGGTPSGPV